MKYQLKATLKHVKPPIWRRVVVPADVPLDILHHTLQIVFGWEDYHLYLFSAARRKYGIPDPDFPELGVESAEETRLSDVLIKPKSKMTYEYDFGDGWEHEIVVEKIIETDSSEALFSCLAGARACPPEDCGGPFGYERLLEILSNPKHPEYDDMSEWIGEEFDAEDFDLPAINKELRDLGREL
jgi:hypothetical protein